MKHLHDTDEFREALSQVASEKLGYLDPTEDSVSLSGKALAELLGIVPSTLTEAVQNKTRAKGYMVHNWSARNSNGRVLEYHVPMNVFKELKGRSPGGFESGRNNPNDLEPNLNGPRLLDSVTGGNTNVHSPTSLLPEGEDYHKSVGLAGASYILRDLLDTDKDQGKAFTTALLTGGLAAGAKFLFESNTAGVAGAVIGFMISMINIESAFAKRMWERNERLQEQQRTKRVFVPVPESKPVKTKPERKPTIQLVK